MNILEESLISSKTCSELLLNEKRVLLDQLNVYFEDQSKVQYEVRHLKQQLQVLKSGSDDRYDKMNAEWTGKVNSLMVKLEEKSKKCMQLRERVETLEVEIKLIRGTINFVYIYSVFRAFFYYRCASAQQ